MITGGPLFVSSEADTELMSLDEIQSVRLEQAELLLGNPGLSIETVASLVGYVSKNQLARLFKSTRGMTPRAWRKTQD